MPTLHVLNNTDIATLAAEFEYQSPQEVLKWALDQYHPRIAICTSFQDTGMVILDMAWRINPAVRIFTLDTGRLPEETYRIIDTVRERYNLPIEVIFPDAQEVQDLTQLHGVNLFRKEVSLRQNCCEVRKVNPLRKKLSTLDGWISGLRRDQSVRRAAVPVIEIDHEHGDIIKINPLATWTHDQVWNYIQDHDVPYHRLYDQGYTSIGCAPCTRATQPGEDPRAGRWWWEQEEHKECGIHIALRPEWSAVALPKTGTYGN
ncbi:MAG: phosphoadenylyl-sulfate reductase [Chloroflexi bacterium]|nr:phosphoadenylyl-sulfate reductase [Chloroflexota bacterium]